MAGKWSNLFIRTFIFTSVCAVYVCVVLYMYISYYLPGIVADPRDSHMIKSQFLALKRLHSGYWEYRALNVIGSQTSPSLKLYTPFADFIHFSWFQYTRMLKIPKSVFQLRSLLYTPAYKPGAWSFKMFKIKSLFPAIMGFAIMFHFPQWYQHPQSAN